MVAPVRVKDSYPPHDENDLATPAREITSRHRLDRRSLLPPRRVTPQAFLAFPDVRSSPARDNHDPGEFWFRLVEAVVAGKFELFAKMMTGRVCAGSRFQKHVRRRRSVS